MAKMRKPKQDELMPPVLTKTQIGAVLDACKGDSFEDRRDTAIIRLFIATGARLSEIAGLRWTPDRAHDARRDLDAGIVRVMGKGRRERVVHAGAKAIKALDRYERKRRQHPAATSYQLLGRPPWTDDTIGHQPDRQGPRRPGRHPGAARAHVPPLLRPRHARGKGVQEGDLMTLAGWRSREMLSRYAAATRADRAIAVSRRLNPGDDL